MPSTRLNGSVPARRGRAQKENGCIICDRPICEQPSGVRKLNSAGVVRPHFLIECENLHIKTAPRALPGEADLPHFVQLSRREREIVQLICDGQSNQEIADETGSSLATVKKHIHSIFRKLEVTSRSRLIALMR